MVKIKDYMVTVATINAGVGILPFVITISECKIREKRISIVAVVYFKYVDTGICCVTAYVCKVDIKTVININESIGSKRGFQFEIGSAINVVQDRYAEIM